jgi:hypothetical protein
MDSILIMDRLMYFTCKNFNKIKRTYIYEDKKKKETGPIMYTTTMKN